MEAQIGDPKEGLPEEVFLFISRITPMVNVDLLIKNKKQQTLLTWREDGIYPPGWHVPGGIIRYKEKFSDRIKAVAASEIGARIRFKKEPVAVYECFQPVRKTRGHFISFLYECKLISSPDPKRKYEKGSPKPGQWAWHDRCPKNIISTHSELYGKYF